MILIEGKALLIHNLFEIPFCKHDFDIVLHALSFFLSLLRD